MTPSSERSGLPLSRGTLPSEAPRGLAPVVSRSGTRYVLGVVSDARVGAETDRCAALADFARDAHRQGARHILHLGAVLAGSYRRSFFEVSLSALEREAGELDAALPPLEGLFYSLLGGSPGELAFERGWFDEARYLGRFFRSRRRPDVFCFGPPGVFLPLGGVWVHLWNPTQAFGQLAEAKLLAKVRSYPAGRKPALLLVGRGPRLVHSSLGDVEAIACPPFGAGAGAGRLLLSWAPGGSRPLRDLRVEQRCRLAESPLEPESVPTLRGTPTEAIPPTERVELLEERADSDREPSTVRCSP